MYSIYSIYSVYSVYGIAYLAVGSILDIDISRIIQRLSKSFMVDLNALMILNKYAKQILKTLPNKNHSRSVTLLRLRAIFDRITNKTFNSGICYFPKSKV